ncbi:MAG: hypothetical protein Q9191_007060 [Dirinaria sp. TL-2023a]
MVRIKHRYLLVNFLYPEAGEVPPPGRNPSSTKPAVPDIVQFNQPTPDYLTPQVLVRCIRDQVQLLYGDYGAGITANGLSVKYLSPATSTAIVRCSRDNYRLVWAALTFTTHLPKPSPQGRAKPCVIRVVRVSGTIRKSEEEAVRRARAAILKAKSGAMESATEHLEAIFGPFDGARKPGVSGRREQATARIEDDDDDDGEELESGEDEDD